MLVILNKLNNSKKKGMQKKKKNELLQKENFKNKLKKNINKM